MLRNLDTALLRTFVTVADHANMTVAGNALHLTQGAISQQIKRLEQTLGCNLFQREARGLRLTPAGERLFGRAKRLLSLNDEIWSEMHADALAGRVRLGVPHDLVAHCLPSIVKAYAQAFPQVEIELVSASSPALTDALKRGDLDLALIEEPAGNNHGECLTIEPLVWVGAKAGAAYQKRPLPLSLVVDTCAFRPVILSALQEGGLSWKTVFENGNLDATAATVRSDLAVTAWLAFTVPPDLDILFAPAGLPALPNFAITLQLARHNAGAATAALADHVREYFARRR